MAESHRNEPWRQIVKAGYRPFILNYETTAKVVTGQFDLGILDSLRQDPRFRSGLLYRMHLDVGAHLTEFRSFKGTFGPGSLQIVIAKKTGRFYTDVDGYNPYEDGVGFVGHAILDVFVGAVNRARSA